MTIRNSLQDLWKWLKFNFPSAIYYIIFSSNDIDRSMKLYLWIATALVVAVVTVMVAILITEALPPGFYDPTTGNFRYISDGFADHRASPFICLFFITGIVIALVFFCWKCMKQMKASKGWRVATEFITYSSGFLTVLGFALLASNPSGEIHFTGASLFIASHLVLQLSLLYTVTHVYKNSETEKTWIAVEILLVLLATAAAIVFAVFLVAGGNLSLSAKAEYFVFAAFVAVNLFASSIITFFSIHFKETEQGIWVWKHTYTGVQKDNEDANYMKIPLEDRLCYNFYQYSFRK